MTFIKEPQDKMHILLPLLYPQSWLDSPAVDFGQPDRTNYEVTSAEAVKRISLTRPQQLFGALSQMAAGLTHRVSSDRLAALSRSIPKILILTGDEDHLVASRNSYWLKKCMPEAEFIVWKDTGRSSQLLPF